MNNLASLTWKDLQVKQGHTRPARWVVWHQSKVETMALNVDRKCLENLGSDGYGGSIRDNNNNWQVGFIWAIVETNPLHAELVAMLQGIELAWEVGIRKLCCYSDSELGPTGSWRKPLLYSPPPLYSRVVRKGLVAGYCSYASGREQKCEFHCKARSGSGGEVHPHGGVAIRN